jgi:VWFA-related protein
MNLRRIVMFAAVVCLTGRLAHAQKDQAPADSGVVLRTETKLVVVDAVVTGKKGEYVRDLKQKDFKVYEDGKEQNVKSFTFEADPSSPAGSQNRYLVLFFDATSMNPEDQIQARQAAGKFVDANAGPNRLIAVVNFTGGLQIAQNFTSNAQRLKGVLSGVKFASVSTADTDSAASPQLSGALSTAAASFAAQDLLLSINRLAKALSVVPGRKTLVLLTAGFKTTPEVLSEITATVDACNKANVAIYPIDVRGLVTGIPRAGLSLPETNRGFLQLAAFSPGSGVLNGSSRLNSGLAFAPQRGGGTTGGAPAGGAPAGGGASGGGGRSGGGPTGGPAGGPSGASGGGRGGIPAPSPTGGTPGGSRGGGTPNFPGNTGAPNNGRGGGTPFGGIQPPIGQCVGICNQRSIIPTFPESATTNQQVMYALADGTGGFVIKDTNDLLGGMQKISQEQDEYYVLGYTPPDSPMGSCHVLKVKVDKGGTQVRARSGYCNVKSRDILSGSPVEKTLETRAAAAKAGEIPASMQIPFFYTAPNVARVQVAMDIDSKTLKFEKQKGKYHAAINVLGIANKADGAVGARFSDTMNLDFESEKEVEAFKAKPAHYENQFDVASGTYNLKVVFSSGSEQFGKLETPLVIEPYDTKEFALSGLALSKDPRPAASMGLGLDAALLEDKKSLIANGVQFVPSGSNEFSKPDTVVFYAELYEPLLVTPNPQVATMVAIKIRVLDRKTGEQKQDSGFMRVDLPPSTGNPIIALGQRLPVAALEPGSYQLEFTAEDTADKIVKRTTDFVVK